MKKTIATLCLAFATSMVAAPAQAGDTTANWQVRYDCNSMKIVKRHNIDYTTFSLHGHQLKRWRIEIYAKPGTTFLNGTTQQVFWTPKLRCY